MTDEAKAKLPLCDGCRDSWYNQPGNCPAGQCYSLQNAEVVERFRIAWWTQPTSPTAYRKVITLRCWNAPGQYAQHTDMPGCFPDRTRALNEAAFDARTV